MTIAVYWDFKPQTKQKSYFGPNNSTSYQSVTIDFLLSAQVQINKILQIF